MTTTTKARKARKPKGKPKPDASPPPSAPPAPPAAAQTDNLIRSLVKRQERPKITPMRELLARAEPVPFPVQVPGENDLWYSRFMRWLTMPRPRSILATYNAERLDVWNEMRAAAQAAPGKAGKVKKGQAKPANRRMVLDITKPFEPTGLMPGDWRDNTALFRWRERAGEYDRAVQESLKPVLAEVARLQTLREIEAADEMYSRALDLIARDPLQVVHDEETGATEFVAIQPGTYATAAKLVEAARIAVRSALGQPDTTTGVQHSGEIGTPADRVVAEAQARILEGIKQAHTLRLAALRRPALSSPEGESGAPAIIDHDASVAG